MKKKHRIIGLGIVLLLVEAFYSPVSAETKPLFMDTDLQTATVQELEVLDGNIQYEEANPYVLNNRYVEIDYQVLKEEAEFLLNLFDGVQLTAVITRIDERGTDDMTLFGKIKNEPISQVIIVVKQSRVTGNIKYRDKVYHIRWMGALVHSVAEIDWTAIPQGGPPVESDVSQSIQSDPLDDPAENNAAASTDDGSSIDIMVVYTQAAGAMGDVHSEIRLAVDDLNQALINSSVSLTFRLVYTGMVDYYETGIALTDLNRIERPGDGYMDGVADLRNAYGADLVALITETMNNWAGLGNLNGGRGSTLVDYQVFHVTVRSGLTWGVFAHEVGHNLGMHHEKYQDSSGGAYSYSHGYVDLTNRFKTIMSYGTQCVLGCQTINYFSSAPSSGVTYNGYVIGDAATADNRQTVINTKLPISKFRQSKSDAELSEIEAVTKGCFIATAAYGSYLDPHVEALREFRDRYLEPYTAGRAVMTFYYRTSPPLAHVISVNPVFRWVARLLLTPLVYLVSEPQKFLLFVLLLVSVFAFRRFEREGGPS